MAFTMQDNSTTTNSSNKTTPPNSNRGVVNTSRSVEKFVILDWLTFTLDYTGKNFRDLKLMLGEADRRDYGAFGYSHSSSVLEKGLVCWSPDRPEQKICVVLPSQALSKLEWGPMELIAGVIKRGGKVTRADFAIDDTDGYLSMEEIHQSLVEGSVVTRWKTYDRLTGKKNIGSDEKTGDTIYVGSRGSESYLRIYDKVLERKAKGIEPEYPYQIRVEVELKGKKAQAVAEQLTQDLDEGNSENFIPQLVLGLIDFKVPSQTESNKSRWQSANWWVEFLGTTSKQKLSLPRLEKTIDEVRDWFDNSIGPMAAVLLLSDVSDNTSGYEWLMAVIANGQSRFKKKHKILAGLQDVN